eukprot:1603792-Prorocentrum_lima.AAC.1
MTSSLVGSEMCIRDRADPEHLFMEKLSTKRCQATAGHQGKLYRWMQANQSVSYTHLTLPTICSV